MKKHNIIFKDLGRGNWNGKVEIGVNERSSPDNIAQAVAEAAYSEVRKHLASAYPDTRYDLEKNEGLVFAGFHTVGSFHVEPPFKRGG